MTRDPSFADSNPPGEYYCPHCEKTFQLEGACPNDGTRLIKLKIAIDPFIGRELDGKYSIVEKLGQGGMGAVYRGSQHSVSRDVAIKVVSPHLVSDSDVIKRFLREAKLASKLQHPCAVTVIDFNQTDDGVFYLVMELVTGRTLDLVIKSEKKLEPHRVVRIGSQVCDALEAAHGLQIVHRDLKPANVMLLSAGRDLVKVLDFGLAKSVAPDQTSTTMTNAGALLGTPAYMPPELALGQSCDGRADLYSLGVILYQMGTGRLPFVSESAHELIALHATERAPAPVGLPPALANAIERLLEKDPDLRYQSATETREALEAALEGRANTPLPWETHPSIGPFPMSSSMLGTNTPAPSAPVVPKTAVVARGKRSGTEMDRLGIGDTMAAAKHDTALYQPKSRKWLVPVVLAGAVLVGLGTYVGVGGLSNDEQEPPPPEQLATPPAPAPAPAPEPKPAPAVTPEIQVAPTPEPKPEPKLEAPKPKTTRPHVQHIVRPKPPEPPKPPPEQHETPKPPPTNKLPF